MEASVGLTDCFQRNRIVKAAVRFKYGASKIVCYYHIEDLTFLTINEILSKHLLLIFMEKYQIIAKSPSASILYQLYT